MSLSTLLPVRRALTVCLAVSLLAGYLPFGHAALVVSGTRVVFPGDKRSVSLIVSNPGERTYAVQTWVNTVADDTTTAVPFITSPPLFKLEPGKEQQVKLNGLPNDLPSDRESLFYFNVQEIPEAQKSDQNNALNIALRTRLKLFYRPAGLKGNPVESLRELQWSVDRVGDRAQLRVDNPTPFHMSFIRIDIKGNGQYLRLNSPTMAAPMSSQTYVLSGIDPADGLQVTFANLNDYGGITPDLTARVRVSP
ncbi:molecular chaperone [Pseudomonas alliivorans]|nr:molecular chaperone [Pseudomonas alliivorans]MEE4885321.1 molecular chaperone [Pseudomonas alliivorans]